MTSIVYKYPIPVDDAIHRVPWLDGDAVTHVQVRDNLDVVDVWIQHWIRQPTSADETIGLRIVGTGQPFSRHAAVVGTTVHPATKLVWHVIREDVRR